MSTDVPPVYTDLNGLSRLRLKAQKDPDSALREVAQQFESIFTRMMIKSMRATVPEGGLMSGGNAKFYQDMYDDQLAVHLASGENGGIGLADVLVRQLSNKPELATKSLEHYQQSPTLPDGKSDAARAALNASVKKPTPTSAPDKDLTMQFNTPHDFIQKILPHAQKAAKQLGTDAGVLVAQAALETGWGKSMTQTHGKNSFNAFNIKADTRWQGDTVTVPTLEFEQGVAVKQQAAFRRYPSLSDSFADYVNFIQHNSRYEKAIQQASDPDAYIQALQDAGYATDPHYAEKIQSILRQSTFQQSIKAASGTNMANKMQAT